MNARTEGQRLLRRYLEEHDVNQADIARSVKVTQAAVSFWMSGENLPDLTSALTLEQITKGEVPARAWTQPPRRSGNGKAA